jgi:hypothetical protein
VKLSVIIVSYNSLSVLKPCLESLRRHLPAGDSEIIVVDNASKDGTPDMVRRDFPAVTLVANEENVGYSRGVNLGIRRAEGRYFLILNPDTVVGGDAIAKMMDFMDRHREAGIVGPKLVFFDGNIQYSCRRFYTWKVLLMRRTFLGKFFKNSSAVRDHLMLDYDHETLREVDWILGACMLVRREAVESVGLMDERFFLYFEDVDWCYRMKQRGWKVYYYPEAVITHGYARESAQTVINRSFLAHLASLVRYYEKWNFLLYFMKKYREVGKVILFLAADVLAFNAAFLAAYYLRVSLHEIFTNPIFPIATYGKFVFYENLLFVFTYFFMGLYRIRRETPYVDELVNIMKAIVLASVLLMTSTYLSKIRTYSRMIVAFLVPFAVGFDWAARTLIRKLHKKMLEQKVDLKRICIIGPSAEAAKLEQKLSIDQSLGLEVVGVIATDVEAADAAGNLGDLSELDAVIDRHRIQEIVLLPGAVPASKMMEIVSMGRQRILDVTMLTDYSHLVVHQAEVRSFAGKPAIAYYRDTRYVFDRLIKRIVDVAAGMIFLVVSTPFFVIYSIYTRLRGGKMFLYEKRLGAGKEEFLFPLAGGGKAAGRERAIPDLFNLPLFWMLLRGKLSIVGPYPLPVGAGELLEKGQEFRFGMRPGITGYWRLSDESELSIENLLAQDADYIRNWSLVLDFKILLRSLGRILSGRNRVVSLVKE